MDVTPHPEYQRPRFIPDLGEEGLSHHEVASALGVSSHHLVEKLKRMDKTDWETRGWNIHVATCKSGRVGRPQIIWYLNTDAAKVFVARWENRKGDGYLAFLLDCERVVLEALPQFKKRVEELLAEVAELRARAGAAAAALPPKKSTVLIPNGYRTERNLFGDEIRTPIFAHVEQKKLTRKEKREAKIHHLSRLITGMSSEMKRLQEQEMVERFSPGA